MFQPNRLSNRPRLPKPARSTAPGGIGIDWADENHAYHCVTPDGKVSAGIFDQDPQAIADWIAQWRKRFPGCQIEICLETSRGALINSLLEQVFGCDQQEVWQYSH